jgi:hypothetical protein
VSQTQALLDEWLARGARLLHVERVALRASPDPTRALSLRLTFDCGALCFEADADELSIVHSDEPIDGSVNADEDEPWWALLGHELRAVRLDVEAGGAARRARLQFRPDDQNPRCVLLRAREGQLRVAVEERA